MPYSLVGGTQLLRTRSIELAEEERRQRRALFIFLALLVVALGLCALAGLRLLAPPSKLIPAGRVEDYTDHLPHRFEVPALSISSLITRRDASISEDVIFVRREDDTTWVALLGVDTLSGCFLYWDAPLGLYRDVNCLGSRYTPDGRYLDGLTSGEQPQPMARLAVEVRDGQVFVKDELDHSK